MRVMKWTSVRCSKRLQILRSDSEENRSHRPRWCWRRFPDHRPRSRCLFHAVSRVGACVCPAQTSDNAAARTAFFEICRAKGWVASMIFVILLAISHVASLSAPPNPPLRTAPATGRGSVVRPAQGRDDRPSFGPPILQPGSAASFVPPNNQDPLRHAPASFPDDRPPLFQHRPVHRAARCGRQILPFPQRVSAGQCPVLQQVEGLVKPCWHSESTS